MTITRSLKKDIKWKAAKYICKNLPNKTLKDNIVQSDAELTSYHQTLIAHIQKKQESLQSLVRRAKIAKQKGLNLVYVKIYDEYLQAIKSLGILINNINKDIEKSSPLLTDKISNKICNIYEVYQDLIALEEEFGNINISLHDDNEFNCKYIMVCTDPVILESMNFGEFQIYLDLEACDYFIEPLSPNCSSLNEKVCHPHVENSVLCEGEGSHMIRKALRENRLYDFFTVINNILHTYNDKSAYIEICNWNGATCDDCGYVMDPDDKIYCECGDGFCMDCLQDCDQCGLPCCNRCRIQCHITENYLCENCAEKCKECHENCSPEHFDEDTQLCSECQECLENLEKDYTNDKSEQTAKI